MNTHAERTEGIFTESAGDFDRTSEGRIQLAQKHERHPVATGESYDLIVGRGVPKGSRCCDHLFEPCVDTALLIHCISGTFHDIHVQDISSDRVSWAVWLHVRLRAS